VAEKRAITPVKGPSQRSASAASGNSSVTSKKEKESNAKKLASATANWRRSKKTKEL
jgi:hypothetical protein